MDEDELLMKLAALSGDYEYVGDDDDDDDLTEAILDSVGGSEIIAGDTEFVGRRAPLRKAMALRNLARMRRQAKAIKRERQGVTTIRETNDRARMLFAGAETTVTAPGIFTLQYVAQEAHRPQRIVLSIVQNLTTGPTVGPIVIPLGLVLIESVTVGVKPQVVTTGGFSAQVFAADYFANGGDLGFDTVQQGTNFTLRVVTPPTVTLISPTDPLIASMTVTARAMR